jgi:hypothetical protein
MTPGDAKSDRALSTHARRLGLLSSNCDSCGASGKRGPQVDSLNPHRAAADMVCADCAGSGRWWFPAIRALGAFTPHLTDTQLRAQVSMRAGRGAVHAD